MDRKTIKRYKMLGYTHWVTIRPPASHEEPGWQPVTYDERRKVYVDANMVEYREARSLDDFPAEWPEPSA